MRYLLLRMKRFCGFLTGFVFFISGIFKLMDPVGTGLIIKGYLEFMHLGFLDPAAKIFGAALALTETILGTGLITGVWRRIIAPATIILQSFFTLITLVLVIFNPAMDCGCFGEAIHLTHGETFVKNIILTCLLLIYYIPQKHLGETKRRKYISFSIVTASVIMFMVYSWAYMPLIEFTDYKPGLSLKTGNTNVEYEARFVYEKDGKLQTFSLEELPDSTWTFVNTETIVKSEEVNSLGLSFSDKDGNYADSLATKGKVIVISIYDTDISEKKWKRIDTFMSNAEKAGFNTLLLASAPVESHSEAFIADYKTLLTLNRSNGGATYFQNGYLTSKWSIKGYPDTDGLERVYSEDITESIIGKQTQESMTFQAFLLYVFAVMLLL
jgi:uncharacterized membrane protein YphA (DoxX/SURF4 family)